MADIADAKSKMTDDDTEIAIDAQLDTDLFEKIGANINYLLTTTDDHISRIADVSGRVSSGGSINNTPGRDGRRVVFSTGTATQSETLNSNSITPKSGNVYIVVGGYARFANGTFGATITFRLLRGANVLTSMTCPTNAASYAYDLSLSNLNYLDTGATADSSNSYTLEIRGTGITSSFVTPVFSPSLHLVGF